MRPSDPCKNDWRRVDALFAKAGSLAESVLVLSAFCEGLIAKLVKLCLALPGTNAAFLHVQGLSAEERLLAVAGVFKVYDAEDPDPYGLQSFLPRMRDALRLRAQVPKLSEADLLLAVRELYTRDYPFDERPKWLKNPDGIALLKHLFAPLLIDAARHIGLMEAVWAHVEYFQGAIVGAGDLE